MLTIDQKAKIISQVAHLYREETVFKDFFYFNDVGVPLSQCYVYGLCEITEEGENRIEETWTHLCIACNQDPNKYFENIDELTKNVVEDDE
jgi:hypothetical protein